MKFQDERWTRSRWKVQWWDVLFVISLAFLTSDIPLIHGSKQFRFHHSINSTCLSEILHPCSSRLLMRLLVRVECGEVPRHEVLASFTLLLILISVHWYFSSCHHQAILKASGSNFSAVLFKCLIPLGDILPFLPLPGRFPAESMNFQLAYDAASCVCWNFKCHIVFI